MSKIATVFSKPRHKALIAYITVGYPDIDTTLRVVPLLAKSRCDIIELGIPFSDPLADGTTIQNASHHALRNGVNLAICLDIANRIKKTADIPLVFMGYYNPILNYGLEAFTKACTGSGIDGLIIPDLPPEEGIELEAFCTKNKMDLIYLIAPTSTKQRIQLVAEKSNGFIYMVSLTGVTGSRKTLSSDVNTFISRVRKVTKKPLCVGFGISTPEQAKSIAKLADGVIVGSRIIQLIEQDSQSLTSVQDFVVDLRKALDSI
jgi:tryptophan synthase alpha chain